MQNPLSPSQFKPGTGSLRRGWKLFVCHTLSFGSAQDKLQAEELINDLVRYSGVPEYDIEIWLGTPHTCHSEPEEYREKNLQQALDRYSVGTETLPSMLLGTSRVRSG